jgi:carbon storage regulator
MSRLIQIPPQEKATMLVLSRKAREELMFPEYGIVVTILEVHGNRVRVGIAAPPHVQVVRREVFDASSRTPQLAEAAPQTTGELALVSRPTVSPRNKQRALRK